MNRRCFIQMSCHILVCLFLTISTASARVCFLPDSADCGGADVSIPDVPCRYYSCREAGLKNEAYQTCYDERTYNNGGVNVTCKQVKCKLSKSECDELEDNPNSTQCCNFDSASGCYYMGKCPILCNRNIYDRTTDLSGEDYTCTSCKDKNGTFYNCTAIEKECYQINSNYTSSCGDSQIAKEVEGIKDSHGNQCYTCEDKPVEKNCSDINKDYKNKDQVYQCNIGSAPVFGVSGSDGQCYQCIKMIDKCLPRDYKIYYVVYPDYLQGDTAIHSGCSCFAYLVKGISSNTDPLNPGGPIKTNAISTPGGNSSSTEKIKLPAILTDVSSSNPYSVKIQENSCYGSEHCSAQAVKFDVFEAYAPETAKRLKEDDDFTITGGITFSEAGYYYTGRQLKPKSQSINSCDDYVVILGNGNPKACAQISSDYYNYQEACPKGYEKKRLPNVYDSTGAQCYTCEKATPVITITYKETYNSLTPGADADPDEYYYKTLKFTSTSSDNVSRTIQMKTYPSKTCKTQYTTGQPVTIEENSETVIASLCGTKSAALPVSSVAALDTFINGTKVYSFEPYYSSHILYDGLDGKTVETNDYTVKFVKEKTCTPTCTSETGCKYGSKTQRDGCGGTCTVCYPPCAIGYWYGSLAQENCYIKPATYIKQPSNPNCSKCVCDNGKPDANGHYLQCQYF